jgi:hypothetical protein
MEFRSSCLAKVIEAALPGGWLPAGQEAFGPFGT